MNIHEQTSLRQRLQTIQLELIEGLGREMGEVVTPKLERLVHILDWVRIEQFVNEGCGVGRPPRDRFAIANAFVAKVVLNLPTTVALIDRLKVDRTLRRICGFGVYRKLPDESIFSRVFTEFTHQRLAERVHEALIKEQLGDHLIGHISRDGTAITAREKPKSKSVEVIPTLPIDAQQNNGQKAADQSEVTPRDAYQDALNQNEAGVIKLRRGRPRKGELRKPKELTRIARQRQQGLAVMLEELPKECDRGTKCNAQGYKFSWNGYKLHLDTADCGVPISAILTSASVHDSQVAVPLSRLSAQRVTNLYDVMDAAYCSEELRQDSRSLGHIPLIDHNARGSAKINFAPHEANRYKERTVAERMNARLKSEFGAENLWVRTPEKVMSHLMFSVLVLSADQLMRLLQ